jgi:RNase P subunit RPR2
MAKASTTSVTTGYCMKCKTQRQMTDAKPVTMKNGRPATQGSCPECGTKMFKIGAGK